MKVVIVGAGFGGMSAAALLARDGFDVTVIEKNEQPGGRGSVYQEAGYTFDMGPSWYLMPDVYEKFFADFGKKPEDFFTLEKLDPLYRIFFYDKAVYDISPELEENYQLFESFEEGGGDKLKSYLASSRELYEFSVNEMLYKDYRSVLDLLSGKLLLKAPKLRLWENLQHYVNKQFKSDQARKILEYAIGFLGGSPQNTPSFYHLVSHADLTLGVWYPQGGMREIVKAVRDLAESYGAEFIYNEPVELLEVHENRVKRVITDKAVYEPDLVVVNADYHHGEVDLLTPEHRTYDETYWEKKILSPSAMVAYLGVNRRVEGLAHHNLFLERDWDDGFNAVFNPLQTSWPENPSYYVNVPSLTDESAAPPGCDTLYILAPLASGLEDTPQLREDFYNRIMDDLEGKLEDKIREDAVVKKFFALNDFQDRYNAYKGTAFGLTHTLDQTALFRPAHRSKKVENLYYTGQYTHPGIGVPMTMVSSQMVAREIQEKYGRN
ncbi:MAG: phytoene desaturase family protein [Methanobacteriaceae archaeon]|nr:phytoene desaturase family protein [Methanobacteriaceae archaeon]